MRYKRMSDNATDLDFQSSRGTLVNPSVAQMTLEARVPSHPVTYPMYAARLFKNQQEADSKFCSG